MPATTEGLTRAPLTAHSPLPARLGAWMMERFPLSHALFHGLLFAAAVLYARTLAGQPATLGAFDLAGFAAAWCFFLLLRVLDEHKDHADDAIHHPDRVLQRGIVTLPQLARVGAVAAAVQLAISLAADGGVGRVTLLWLAAMAWVLLMAREFFVRDWLRPRLLAYATTHMAVMALVAVWLAQLGTPGTAVGVGVLPLAAVAFLSGFVFEVARKLRAPEEERPGVDTYTSRLGIGRAPLVLLALLVAAAGAVLTALLALPGPVGTASMAAGGALALLVLVGAVPLLRFRGDPTPARAKAAAAAPALAMLGCYAVLAAALAARGALGW